MTVRHVIGIAEKRTVEQRHIPLFPMFVFFILLCILRSTAKAAQGVTKPLTSLRVRNMFTILTMPLENLDKLKQRLSVSDLAEFQRTLQLFQFWRLCVFLALCNQACAFEGRIAAAVPRHGSWMLDATDSAGARAGERRNTGFPLKNHNNMFLESRIANYAHSSSGFDI